MKQKLMVNPTTMALHSARISVEHISPSSFNEWFSEIVTDDLSRSVPLYMGLGMPAVEVSMDVLSGLRTF